MAAPSIAASAGGGATSVDESVKSSALSAPANCGLAAADEDVVGTCGVGRRIVIWLDLARGCQAGSAWNFPTEIARDKWCNVFLLKLIL